MHIDTRDIKQITMEKQTKITFGKRKVFKQGNSILVVIPELLVKNLGITQGELMNFTMKGNEVTIELEE